jgi:hypothetical protein
LPAQSVLHSKLLAVLAIPTERFAIAIFTLTLGFYTPKVTAALMMI